MRKDIIVINKDSNIAISTLWSKKELILEKIPENVRNKICIIGTTYTAYGVNFILETLAEYNKIDTLIVFGSDLSMSGRAIIDIFNKKDIKNYKIVFSLQKIEEILKTVKVIDLREEYKKGEFERLIDEINKNYDPATKSIREKIDLKIEEKNELISWPIPLSGHYIYDTNIFRAWIKILDLIMRFGSIKFSEYEEPQKEYLNLMVTIGIYGKEYKIDEEFFEFLNQEEFEKHISTVLNLEKIKNVEYTYGERFFKHRHGKNQIEYIINKLIKTPYSRRAIAISWEHSIDQDSKNPPCIIGIQGIITENFYNHTVWIRSNDMVKAWPLNIFGQLKLAEYIVNNINNKTKANFEIGTVTTISTSAHIYEHDWNLVREILNKYSYCLKEFVEDPKGLFLIYEKDEKVVLEHRTPDNSTIDFKIESKNFWEIYNALKGGSFFSLSDHSLYIGKELMRAFEKIKKGEKYVQDEA